LLDQKVKSEATAAVDQLQGTESEVRALHSMTQRMVLTQSEMVCTSIVVWSFILCFLKIYSLACHLAGGSCP